MKIGEVAVNFLKTYVWFIRFVAALSLVFLVAGGWASFQNYRFAQVARATTGSVVFVEKDASGNNITYRPHIFYTDGSGETHVAPTAIASTGYNFAIGADVPVLYAPQNPEVVRFDSWFGRWGLGAMFLIAAVVLAIIALFAARMVAGGQVGVLFGIVKDRVSDATAPPDQPPHP